MTTVPPDMTDIERLYELFREAVAVVAAAGDVDAVRKLAEGAVPLGFDTIVGCDGCDGRFDEGVLEAADALIPPSQTAYDSNGDPDVTICGFCVLAANDEPHFTEADMLDDIAAREREETMVLDSMSTVDVCAFDVGDAAPCRCLLPLGHQGIHQCLHTIREEEP